MNGTHGGAAWVSRGAALALLTALVLALGGAQLPAQQATLNPNQQAAHDVYKELIETNSSVMTSGTTVAAQEMAKRYREAGFPESDIFLGGVRPDKFNVVLRYHGKGGPAGPKPLLLLAHIDVVEALKTDWSPDIDPFKFMERDGYYYGRGTSDDKAMAAIFVANIIRLKKEGYVPERDIIVALTADEEGGCCNGARWLVQNHRELVDAAYVINEGGGGSLRDGKPFLNNVQATEKVFGNFTVTAKNRGGHSSVPRPDNAIYELAEGLVRFSHFNFPVQFNEVTRAYLERTAAIESPDVAAAMRALLKNPNDLAASAVVSGRDPRYNSTLRTTCVATMLAGGHATNALPQTASATINCRMLPNTNPADVRAEIVKALADTALEVSAAAPARPSAPSPLLPEVMSSIETITRQMFGNIPVVPIMGTGATDSQAWRTIGIPAYGVSGLMGDPEDVRAHGRDERMLVKSFYDGQEFLYRLTKALTSTRTVP
jgi:acetylornithine deacetylase/succinyl-diaminopimelate desuccinylase-like protein